MKKILFTTNSNLALAKKILTNPGWRLGKVEVKRFADQEISVFIKENVKNKEVYVIGSSFPPGDNLLELLILINTLKVNGAKKITTIIPYFGYAKADHIKPPGASLAGKLIVQMIESSGASKIIVINLHSERVVKFFSKPLIHLDAIPLLTQHFKKNNLSDFVIASPDLGGVKRVKQFAKSLGVKDIVTIKKHRPKFDEVVVDEVIGDVKGKDVIIVDDMIQSGGTIIKATQALKKNGAKSVHIAVVHFLFTGPALALLNKDKNIQSVTITDSIPAPTKLPAKFNMISLIDLLN